LQVASKDKDDKETTDFPYFNTAQAARSHMKCYVLEAYQVDLGDKILFPKWKQWWVAYQGEVLKPKGKMKVRMVFWVSMVRMLSCGRCPF